MTGQEIANDACAMAGQTPLDSEDWLELTAGLLSVMLQELLPYENSLRKGEGRPELAAAPRPSAHAGMAGLNETIDYDEGLLRTAGCYYLASKYLQADERVQQGMVYHNFYVDALESFRKNRLKARTVKVRDVYAI